MVGAQDGLEISKLLCQLLVFTAQLFDGLHTGDRIFFL